MNIFLDTSFLCSMYRQDANSETALRYTENYTKPFLISNLVLLEFRQSCRLQVFRFFHDKTQGFSEQHFEEMQEQLSLGFAREILQIEAINWPAVHELTEQLSAKYTAAGGHRMMDIIHVATALHVKATHLYTFDDNQSQLAKKAGLKTNAF